MTARRLAPILAATGSAIFLTSLPFNAFCVDQGSPPICYPASQIAIVGGIGWLTFEPGNLCWFATPLGLIALWLIRQKPAWRWTSLVLAVGALALAVAFPVFGHVSDIAFFTDNPGQNTHMAVALLGPAYWVWLLAMVVACAAAIVNARIPRASGAP